MGVVSLPEDKPKIVFHAAMMAIQNFGFFIMYFIIASGTPNKAPCADTFAATAFMALTCFMVAFLCIGMGFGGYTDDKTVFTLYWCLHLAGGACYTYATFAVPLARFSDDGDRCNDSKQNDILELVYYMHAALYLVYVGGMLSITYFSFLKPTYFTKRTPESAPITPSI